MEPYESHPSIDPAPVDETTEKLSALLDGELDSSELLDLEQLAVDTDTTIDALSVDLAASKTAITELGSDPAPSNLRVQHIGAALDAMDSPEVVSLSAARVQRQTEDRTKAAKAQRLNDRLRRLTAVAAVVAVVAGFGFLSLQGLDGSDDDEAASSSDDSTASAATLERATAGGSSDDGSSGDDALADEVDSTQMAEESDDSSSEAPESNDAADFTQAEEPVPPLVADDIALPELTLSELPEELLERSSVPAGSTAPVVEPVCLEAAAQLVPEEQIVEGIAVQQGGSNFELVVLINQELLVFELPQCVQVD
ncbi:MAG: hypothetical protein ACN4GZ_02160 [Acidimicrobiales bacterium]